MRTLTLLLCLTSALSIAQNVPVKVAVGATVAITKHVPASARERFTVEAAAGQTLLVDLADMDGKVQVFGPGGATKALPSVDLAGASDWMNVVSKAGTYEIAVTTKTKKPFDMTVTLMDPHDPRLDPGIKPEQISLDLGALGGKPKFSRDTFRPSLVGELDDPWPANINVQQEQIEFRIMALEGIKKRMARDKEWPSGLARLEAALKPGGKVVAPEQLPPGYTEAALMYGSRAEFIEGPSVRALRYLGQFAQDEVGPTSRLMYVLFGISRDGKYLVMIRGPIFLASIPNSENVTAAARLKVLRADAAKRVAAATPESFKPTLGQMDAIVKSLRLP